jgi:hypothetical protein
VRLSSIPVIVYTTSRDVGESVRLEQLGAAGRVRATLKEEYRRLAGKLENEIARHMHNEEGKELLLQIHKDGNVTNDVLRQVEKEMDIDELKFSQLLPKEPEQGSPPDRLVSKGYGRNNGRARDRCAPMFMDVE